MDIKKYQSFLCGLLIGIFCSVSTFYILDAADKNRDLKPLVQYQFSHKDLKDAKGPSMPIIFHGASGNHSKNESIAAQQLFQDIKVLCWVLTSTDNHHTKAVHVKATWGKRCNKLIFMSSSDDPNLPSVDLNTTEGHENLWGKTKAAFQYVYDNHLEQYDWFFKADDDTYVIVENLRYMLSIYNSSSPLYFGRKFRKFTRHGYMSGGAGYVLSKEAVRRLVEQGLPNPKKCRRGNKSSEDVEIGKCMENLGVIAGDSRDEFGQERFMPFHPQYHLIPSLVPEGNWYWDYVYYKTEQGLSCCSDSAISFHYIAPNQMYEMEYLIYHLRPYGIQRSFPFPANLPPDKKTIPLYLLKERLEDHGKELNKTSLRNT